MHHLPPDFILFMEHMPKRDCGCISLVKTGCCPSSSKRHCLSTFSTNFTSTPKANFTVLQVSPSQFLLPKKVAAPFFPFSKSKVYPCTLKRSREDRYFFYLTSIFCRISSRSCVSETLYESNLRNQVKQISDRYLGSLKFLKTSRICFSLFNRET